MMNSLNSVLIEGDVLSSVLDADSGVLMLQLQSKRFYKNRTEGSSDENVTKELLKVNAVATGKLAENTNEFLSQGSRIPGVRVVGRLTEFLDMGLVIYAEHIEIRPTAKSENTEE